MNDTSACVRPSGTPPEEASAAPNLPDDPIPTRRGEAARSMLWSLLESGGLTATSLVTLIVFAHLLAPAELGSAAMALSSVSVVGNSLRLKRWNP